MELLLYLCYCHRNDLNNIIPYIILARVVALFYVDMEREVSERDKDILKTGNPYRRGRFSTVDLLDLDITNVCYKATLMMRSTVLSLSLW